MQVQLLENNDIEAKSEQGIGDVLDDTGTSAFTAMFPANRAEVMNKQQGYTYQNGFLFTAHEIRKRSTDSLRNQRESNRVGSANRSLSNLTQQAIAHILMPRTNNDMRSHVHNYDNNMNDSLLTRLQSNGAMSTISTGTLSLIEKVTGGYLSDSYGENIDKLQKSVFQDSSKREWNFGWDLTFNSKADLVEFAKVYTLFTVLGYAKEAGKSNTETTSKLKQYLTSFYDYFGEGVSENSPFLIDGIDDLFSYRVITQPPVWYIREWGDDKRKLPHSTFGPAGLVSARFDMAPDQIFKAFAEYPNDPISVRVELQFRELIALRQHNVMD
ncbi:TPA: baseplate tail-tube junction protein [Vibrio parahaemolyticus]|nr:baseplate tail-tube junction protein [Vibrio parahaemolyticus]HCE2814417.1 baseplate tail-tube junction protein [Vibrio parahaemolyticus]HCE2818712.1 baseplate tail-tube junction protein [Vibrio parahaemolyticus]HCG5303167.1 baseplate tail-tube junction protein [Vibrio parahaemolyticus]HCG5307360.1 baseplate tail-tube junction protein [Vibrio parahaemolyticus]